MPYSIIYTVLVNLARPAAEHTIRILYTISRRNASPFSTFKKRFAVLSSLREDFHRILTAARKTRQLRPKRMDRPSFPILFTTPRASMTFSTARALSAPIRASEAKSRTRKLSPRASGIRLR